MAGKPSDEVSPGILGRLTNTLAFINEFTVVVTVTHSWSSTPAKPPSSQIDVTSSFVTKLNKSPASLVPQDEFTIVGNDDPAVLVNVGDTVGNRLGEGVWSLVAANDGTRVGNTDGVHVGDEVGKIDGEAVGELDRCSLGARVGRLVGCNVVDSTVGIEVVGNEVGNLVKLSTGPAPVGRVVGERLFISVGKEVVSAVVGNNVGPVVGKPDGDKVKDTVGKLDGVNVGEMDGQREGLTLGFIVGLMLG
mmetsp:Transcript_21765/g.31684  ORF Transcript_21765/g.31684 Transcript_21765/m.31684 type:complete len:248 (+) Transcript_21765:2017-2760(+)